MTIGWESDDDFVFESLGFQQFDLETRETNSEVYIFKCKISTLDGSV